MALQNRRLPRSFNLDANVGDIIIDHILDGHQRFYQIMAYPYSGLNDAEVGETIAICFEEERLLVKVTNISCFFYEYMGNELTIEYVSPW
jgi:hypothetical protein